MNVADFRIENDVWVERTLLIYVNYKILKFRGHILKIQVGLNVRRINYLEDTITFFTNSIVLRDNSKSIKFCAPTSCIMS